MLTIERILYPTDFSPCAGHALPHTLRLAERYSAELHFFHALVLHESDPGNMAHRLPSMEELYQVLEEQADNRMREAVEPKAGTFTVRHAQVRALSAAGAILDYAAERQIDLIVMGTHGRRGLRRLLMGSVAEEVVRLAPCPVLTVPEQEEREGLAADHVERIVVPVDFSKHARLALTYARELARLYGAHLHLLHVVDEVVYPDFYPPVLPSGGPITKDLRDQSLERLRELLSALDPHGIHADVHVRTGRAAPEIADFSRDQAADLVVIASHGLTGLRHMLLGSVSEQVVRRACCPVLTLKAFGKSLLEGQAGVDPPPAGR